MSKLVVIPDVVRDNLMVLVHVVYDGSVAL